MATVPFVPVYLAFAGSWIAFYARTRQQCRPRGVRLIAYILLGIYLEMIIYVAFTPFVFSLDTLHFDINIVPVVESYLMLKYGYLSAALYNLIGNFVMMMPFAMLVPIVFTNMNRWWQAGCAAFLASLCIESLQLIFAVRIFDVDDLILNTLGAMLGYALLRCVAARLPVLARAFPAQNRARYGDFPLTFGKIVGCAGGMGLVIGVVCAATLSTSWT